jgi:2-polyprenyl-6-methoxyphenol hydroxylase-like FAD-dependent oxidoreductase
VPQEFDVVCLGGGVAGEAIAVGLQDSGLTLAEIGNPVMMHDPSLVTDGIEVSPDDQIIAARRGAYLVSVAQRTGGWQRRGTVADASSKSASEPALATQVSPSGTR